MDYGTDVLLVDDDIAFTADGEVDTVSGAALIAQDIDQTLKSSPGVLFWDAAFGSSLPHMLNDSGADEKAIIAELKRVAIADARVNPQSVKAYKLAQGKFRLEFMPLRAVKPEILDYDLRRGES